MAARQTDWLGTENTSIIGAGTYGVLPVLPATVIHKGDTLVRVRGNVLCHVDTAQVDDEVAACGLILANENAVAAGVPNPEVDTDADWLWHSWFTLYAEGVAQRFPWERQHVDNKSMRKVPSGVQELVFVASSPSGVGTHWTWGFRILRKLP